MMLNSYSDNFRDSETIDEICHSWISLHDSLERVKQVIATFDNQSNNDKRDQSAWGMRDKIVDAVLGAVK